MAVTGGNLNVYLQAYQSLLSTTVPNAQNLTQAINPTISWTNGTAAQCYDLLHVKTYNLAGSTQSIDLTSVADISGATVNMARVRALMFVNLATTSGYTLTIDTTVSNGFKGFSDGTSGSKRRVHSSLSATSTGVNALWNYDLCLDAYSVGAGVGATTSGTSKVITLDPGANTFSVWAFILGCSAVS